MVNGWWDVGLWVGIRGGGCLGAVITGCVVYGIQLGWRWGCVVSGLVCLTSSGFSSMLLFSLSKIVITGRWPLLAEICSYFLLLNTIINPYYHSCGFMAVIDLTISYIAVLYTVHLMPYVKLGIN